jgi:hypothetical protein
MNTEKYDKIIKGFEELMKGKPKSFEVAHFIDKIKLAGDEIGKSIDDMKADTAHINGL